jgi:DNA processing protein
VTARPVPSREGEAGLGLALVADLLGRDLQRAARAAGSPAALWALDAAGMARLLRLDAEDAARLAGWDRRGALTAARVHLQEHGATLVGAAGAPAAPARLGAIYDPPLALFAEGDWCAAAARMAESPVIAVVGSRRPSAAGRAFARELAAALTARGALVVSGLALGVDAAAHEGALDAGGHTVAVLGAGLSHGYPRANAQLRARIRRAGCLLSEYWLDTPPAPWRFPARNRIVAGLAHAVVVVEAGARSGALITADFALEAGRPVLAVPGAPWSDASEGCNALIRAGAALCCGVDDVVAEVAHPGWRDDAAVPAELPEGFPAEVHARLREAPRRVDELAGALGRDAASVSAALALLEMDGHVLRGEGQRYWATPRAAR